MTDPELTESLSCQRGLSHRGWVGLVSSRQLGHKPKMQLTPCFEVINRLATKCDNPLEWLSLSLSNINVQVICTHVMDDRHRRKSPGQDPGYYSPWRG